MTGATCYLSAHEQRDSTVAHAKDPHHIPDGVTEGNRTPDLQGHNLAL